MCPTHRDVGSLGDQQQPGLGATRYPWVSDESCAEKHTSISERERPVPFPQQRPAERTSAAGTTGPD
eukprot:scaffold3_cov389-Prasinococcus_capsulatus_cf.AAC.9